MVGGAARAAMETDSTPGLLVLSIHLAGLVQHVLLLAGLRGGAGQPTLLRVWAGLQSLVYTAHLPHLALVWDTFYRWPGEAAFLLAAWLLLPLLYTTTPGLALSHALVSSQQRRDKQQLQPKHK